MSRQGVFTGKTKKSILKLFNKHHSDFNNVFQSKQVISRYFSFIQTTNNNGCYRYADKTVMPVFCKYMKKNKNKKIKIKIKNKNIKTNK